MSKHSEACCTIPPVISEGYKAKGDYQTFDGMKTYVTGPSDADTMILVVYDIFGFKDQIIQGADIMAYSDSQHPVQVFMPDFFEGEPANIAWYPPDTEEKKEKLNKWFEKAAPPKHLPRFPKLMGEIAEKNPKLKQFGIIGYCWGGKMASLIAGKDTRFSAAVQTSPAMVDPEDAKNVKIPMMMLASKEEPADDVKKYDEALTVKKHIETFGDQLHGFMSARADLNDAGVKKEYERGYKLAIQWFQDNLSPK